MSDDIRSKALLALQQAAEILPDDLFDLLTGAVAVQLEAEMDEGEDADPKTVRGLIQLSNAIASRPISTGEN